MEEVQPTLALQTELRENGLEYVSTKFAIQTRRHKMYPNLVCLKYRDLNAKFHKKLVQEARGIVLDEDNDWKVISWPYLKFFNFSEKLAAPIDWESAKVYEKCDGCLATLYYYKNQWHVSSSGIPDAAAKFSSPNLIPCNIPFKDLFWQTWEKLKMKMPNSTKYCYVFELVTLAHVIVVRPKKDQIVLHGVRDMTTLQELEPEPVAKQHGWECAKTYPFKSLEEVRKAAWALNPIYYEGFVVCDKNFNRIKVKTPQYVALANLSEADTRGLNFHHMIKILVSNEVSEFLGYFPQHKRLFELTKNAFSRMKKEFKQQVHLTRPEEGEKIKPEPSDLTSEENIRISKRLAQLEPVFPMTIQAFFQKIIASHFSTGFPLEELYMQNLLDQNAFTELVQQFLLPDEALEIRTTPCAKKKKKKGPKPLMEERPDEIEYVTTLKGNKREEQQYSSPSSKKKQKQAPPPPKKKKGTPPPNPTTTKKSKAQRAADAEFDALIEQYKAIPKQEGKKKK